MFVVDMCIDFYMIERERVKEKKGRIRKRREEITNFDLIGQIFCKYFINNFHYKYNIFDHNHNITIISRQVDNNI